MVTRKQFLEDLIATQTAEKPSGPQEDEIFNKYANKKLPDSKRTTSYLNQYSGTWSEVQVLQLLNRTMFGVKAADIQTLLNMDMSDAVDYLLSNIPAAPSPPVNNYSGPGNTDITGVAFGQPWVTAPVGDGTLNDYRRYSYKAWWFGLMLNQNLSIQEKMVFFWHNHFATQTYVVGDARLSYNHNVLLRNNALGNFQTFVNLVTTDPAMLMYLNGNSNTSNDPDENYGRELQDLFTIGENNNPNYTEDDVKAASRVLTGWRVNNTTLGSFFVPQVHDTGDKQFSSFYNNTVISGQGGANGANETTELISMIFTKFETAHTLCTDLYRFFVYYNITPDIDTNVIIPLAQILVNNNFEILPVLQCLFKSEHFYDPNNAGCYIKSPLDFIVGIYRTFNLQISSGLDAGTTYALWDYLQVYGINLGLDLGDPPNVAGWMPFYQSPAFYEIWINSNTYPLRQAFTNMMLSSGFNAGTETTLTIDVLEFTQQYANASDPDMLINYLVSLLLGISISATEQTNLKTILLSGQIANSYWTAAWNNFVTDPSTENTSVVYNRLSALYTALLSLPEFQLC